MLALVLHLNIFSSDSPKVLYITQLELKIWSLSVSNSGEVETPEMCNVGVSHDACAYDISWCQLTGQCDGRHMVTSVVVMYLAANNIGQLCPLVTSKIMV